MKVVEEVKLVKNFFQKALFTDFNGFTAFMLSVFGFARAFFFVL